jgi:hypothetical protein
MNSIKKIAKGKKFVFKFIFTKFVWDTGNYNISTFKIKILITYESFLFTNWECTGN